MCRPMLQRTDLSRMQQLFDSVSLAAESPAEPPKARLREVCALMEQITPADLGLQPTPSQGKQTDGPCVIRTQTVHESPAFDIVVFLFPAGAAIPLHDHPNMTVLSRVVRGSLRVTSFDVGADGKARRSISLMTSADGPAALFPSVNNVHEFQAGAGGAVVLDVIVPPYDEDAGRACHYFEAVVIGDGVFRLREIPEPADFECLGAVYQGLRP